MIKLFLNRINNDLKESQIDLKVAIAFIPIAFFTFLFHESGHWVAGEIFGNDMTMSLNNSSPRNNSFIHGSHALYSSIGGPAFTILQAIVFLFLTKKAKSVYAFSVMFFAVFSRFFSILFGGISEQDEGMISSMLNINPFWIAVTVLLILFIIAWRGMHIMNLNAKAAGYFTTLSTLAILIVIGVNEFLN